MKATMTRLDAERCEAQEAEDALRAALVRVADALRTQYGGAEEYFANHTWNPEAHVELTLTVADVRAVFAALRREGEAGKEGAA